MTPYNDVMTGFERRHKILEILRDADMPVSASRLAEEFDVSRQVIVGDVALLRARGQEIISTPRGYAFFAPVAGRYIGKISCMHGRAETIKELTAIVQLGAEVLDVQISHPHFGELSGPLNLATLEDVERFDKEFRQEDEHLLSELTGGIHIHTISCKDKELFDRVEQELDRLGFLYKE
jgi:transcriptional regulator of NAD metabolism